MLFFCKFSIQVHTFRLFDNFVIYHKMYVLPLNIVYGLLNYCLWFMKYDLRILIIFVFIL